MNQNTQYRPSSGGRPVAVVTGASSGIGAAVATRLADTMDVVLVARRADRLGELAEHLGRGAQVCATDVTDPDQVARLSGFLQSTYGQVDVLVNAAGARPERVLTSMDLDEVLALWHHQVQLNLTGAATVCFAVAPHLRRPGASIVNVGSIAAVTGGRRPGSTAYAAAKAGLHGLTLGLSRELAGEGITVNTVAPGFVAGTEFTGAWGPEITEPLVAETPAGRAGTVEDVANAVAYLSSGQASFVTGQNLAVNGGMR